MGNSVKLLVIYTGSVESVSLFPLTFRHSNGFSTVYDAVRSLGDCLYDWAVQSQKNSVYGCCKKSLEKGRKRCDTCESPLPDLNISFDTLEYYIGTLQGAINDGTSDLFEILDIEGWQTDILDKWVAEINDPAQLVNIASLFTKNAVIFAEQGENALLYSQRDKLTCEDEAGFFEDGVISEDALKSICLSPGIEWGNWK